MNATKILWGQVLLVSVVVLAFVWGATEWVAWRLAFQSQLGRPWFEFFGWPVYQPPAFFWWWFAYDAYARDIFVEGAYIAASGGIAAVVVAIAMSVWRAREVKARHHLWLGALGRSPREIREAGLLGHDGVLLGRWRDHYLRHDGPEHVLCFAPTRSGKGVGLVVPTLLTWSGSAIVHDIKGENWTLTAGWRARFGRVLLFDPTNAASAAYNPLLEVRRGEWEVRDVQNIADVLVDPEGALERRNHWEKTSHSLLVGAILHVLYAEPDKTLAGVANFLSDPRRPIETTLRAMMTTPHLGERGVHPVIASSARELLNKSENERSGVLSTAMSFLGLYRDPVVAAVTRRCDWRIRDLVEGRAPATLYLVVPPSDISRTKPLVRLILNQIGRRLTEELEAEAATASPLADARRIPGSGPARLFRERARLHGGLWPQELPDCPIPEPDREGLRPEQLDPRQLPCARELRDQRRAHGQAGVRCPWHGDRNARHEELCRPPAQSLARAPDGVAARDRPALADARRGDAAPERRRTRAGFWLSADPREEGALLHGCGAESADPSAADPLRVAPSRLARKSSKSHPKVIGPTLLWRRRQWRLSRTRQTPASDVSPSFPSMRK